MNFKIIILTFAMLGVSLPAFAKDDEHCLEGVWQRTNPTDEEKKFDIENDKAIADFLKYSCEINASASEVHELLEKTRTAIKSDDKKGFAALIYFPFALYPEDHFVQFTEGLVVMDTPEEIIEHYDAIVNDNFRKIMACASVNNMYPFDSETILIAGGYFRIELNEDMSLKLGSVSTYGEKAIEWYGQYCQ